MQVNSLAHVSRTRLSLLGALAAVLLPSLPVIAQTQPYPNKPVRVVVAFTAGGTTDIIARSIGQQLSERLKLSNMPEFARAFSCKQGDPMVRG